MRATKGSMASQAYSACTWGPLESPDSQQQWSHSCLHPSREHHTCRGTPRSAGTPGSPTLICTELISPSTAAVRHHTGGLVWAAGDTKPGPLSTTQHRLLVQWTEGRHKHNKQIPSIKTQGNTWMEHLTPTPTQWHDGVPQHPTLGNRDRSRFIITFLTTFLSVFLTFQSPCTLNINCSSNGLGYIKTLIFLNLNEFHRNFSKAQLY